MDYTKIYNSLIEKRRTVIAEGYTENHHIVPRCMNGTDDATNIVALTPEEHYLAHLLLCKIHPGNHRLVKAAMFLTGTPSGKRQNNKVYGWLRRKLSDGMKESNPNAGGKARRKYLETNPAPAGWKHSAEAKKLHSQLKLGDKNPNKDGKARRTETYLINEITKNIDLTFESLASAESFFNANHTTVWLHRKSGKPLNGYYWCVGKTELSKTKGNQ